MLQLVLTRSKTVTSFGIRVFTGSLWSHVGILTPEGTVLESQAPHGVREVPLATVLSRASEHLVLDYADIDAGPVIAAARSQLGKSYDYLAIVAFYFRARWDDDSSWFCSEYVAWSINTGWHPVFRTREVSRVTPQDLLKVSFRGLAVA